MYWEGIKAEDISTVDPNMVNTLFLASSIQHVNEKMDIVPVKDERFFMYLATLISFQLRFHLYNLFGMVRILAAFEGEKYKQLYLDPNLNNFELVVGAMYKIIEEGCKKYGRRKFFERHLQEEVENSIDYLTSLK